MDDDVEAIIRKARSYEGKDAERRPEKVEVMQKLTISELAYSQLEQMKLKSGVQLKKLIPILVDAAYSGGLSEISVDPECSTRRWYVLMAPDVRQKLDKLCDASGGVSPGLMIGDIVYRVSSNFNDSEDKDIVSVVNSMKWGVA